MPKKLNILLFLFAIACNAQKSGNPKMEHKFNNELINESSPYLLQHAHNPVHWYPWGEHSLEKAKNENKLIIISIGYAACHWCHVMEHESFEDTAVAALMNKHFVSIKVDREERPDIDQIYMNVAQMISGRGGWPLNAIALPDGRPVYAATYFPKDQWTQFLLHFQGIFEKDPNKLLQQAENLTQGLNSMDQVLGAEQQIFEISDIESGVNKWKQNFDFEKGGRKGAPKFPMPNMYMMLLRYHYFTSDEQSITAVRATLTNMANGGIYDHLGGGFARYSTDPNWIVPHFEKMLYDNGQLVSLYSEAYRQAQNELYKQVVFQTLEYIQREMTSPEGGFYSSLDADSEGEEGKYYIWTKNEIENILGKDAGPFCEYYNIKNGGNWEHQKNIPYVTKDKSAIAQQYNLDIVNLEKILHTGRSQLLKERNKRVRPGLDDKILTSWNALMLKGYIDAYRTFNVKEYLAAALRNAHFIDSKCMQQDGRLNRNYKNGKSTVNGFLDDYALTMEAFIALYQVTFDEQWLTKANVMAEYVLKHFIDNNNPLLYYTSDLDPKLVTRPKETSDNVIPASNSSFARALYYLGIFYYKEAYIVKSKQMAAVLFSQVKANTGYYSNWAWLILDIINEPYEVAILGKENQMFRVTFDKEYHPDILFLGGEKEGNMELLQNKLVNGKTTIYVCKDKTCKLPVNEVKKALEQIQ